MFPLETLPGDNFVVKLEGTRNALVYLILIVKINGDKINPRYLYYKSLTNNHI